MNVPDTNPSYDPAPSRDLYERKMETRLQELGAQMDIWTAKAESLTAVKLAELKLKRQEAKKQLEELQITSNDAWAVFKVGMDKCFDDLKMAMEELKQASSNAAAKFQKH
jgi:hypothetical protein